MKLIIDWLKNFITELLWEKREIHRKKGASGSIGVGVKKCAASGNHEINNVLTQELYS